MRVTTTVAGARSAAASGEVALHEPGRSAAGQDRRATGDGSRAGRATRPGGARPRAPPARGRWGPSAVGPAERRPTPGTPPPSRRRTAACTACRCASTSGSGSSTSPMPVTRARPPRRQNGTSAPRRHGHVEVVAAGPAQHGGGVGRAAAEAAAGGDALVDVHGGRAARAPAAPCARGWCRRSAPRRRPAR